MSHDHHHEHATVFTANRDLLFDDEISEQDLKIKIGEILSDIATSLKKEGCTLIGHIKGQLDAQEEGTIYFSLTTFNGSPRFKSEIKTSIIQVKLTINIIVYGILGKSVENIFKQEFGKYF